MSTLSLSVLTARPSRAARRALPRSLCGRHLLSSPRASLDVAQLTAAAGDALFGSPLKLAGTLGISFASFRAILYFHLQYLLAAHISNNVPPGAKVVEFGCGTGTHLYYYPPGTGLVYGVDTKAEPGLLLTVGAQAGVAVSAQKVSSYCDRLTLEAASMDAAVSVGALGSEADPAAAVAEAARVLKPGSPLLFFEPGAAPSKLTEALRKSGDFASVRYDDKWAGYPLGAHAIGIAVRNDAPSRGALGTPGVAATRSKAPTRDREPSAASQAKGFGAKGKQPPPSA